LRIRPHQVAFTLLLAAMVGMPALSIDMSLPALSIITNALGVSDAAGPLTLTTLLAGFGATQLVFGPVSDRFGRRPVLLLGLGLFGVAGLLCMVAPSLPFLLGARLLQGIGAAAGTVLAFAMVRDCFEGHDAARRIATINAVMAVAPIVAPVIGAGVLALAGWRGIFAVLAAFGLGLWAVAAAGAPETIRVRNAQALRPSGLLRAYGRVLRDRSGFGHVMIGAFAFGNLFSFISGSPLVYVDQLGLKRAAFAVIFAAASAGLMAGSLVVGRLKWGSQLMPAGLCLGLAASLGMLALYLSGHFTPIPSAALLVLNSFACGMVFPTATHRAIDPFPDIAGVASALTGAVRMAGGAVASAVMAPLYDGTPLAMSLGLTLFAGAGLATWAGLIRGTRPALVQP
jgi:DHA1 family bicyclomycin/chloramphenicol resistance-like MFS transporter